jgi:6-phosphogluconolactonase (cycloisomerase 2 family)
MHYLPRKLPRTIVAGAVTLASAGLVPAVASAHSSHAGYVYVDDNTTGTNSVAAFAEGARGKLTPVAGSPFKAGGAGTGTGLASQGSIQVASNGRYVLAVDAGSNQISVLRIARDGALELADVVSSGGTRPVSIAEHDGLVYVANAGNAGAGGENYTGFTLGEGGQLRPMADSTVPLPDGAQPGDVLFNSTGSNLVGTRVGSSQIDSFSVDADGRLAAAPGSPYAAQAAGPFASEFRPTDPSQLFVSNAHAGAGNGTVSAFSVAADGALSSIGDSPFADNQTAPCWVEITHDGQYLFTVNTMSGSISSYSIAGDGTLTLLGSTPVGSQSGIVPVDARLSADGQTLYVDESAAPAIGEFDVDGGQLTAQGSVSLPAGATPAGLAVK